MRFVLLSSILGLAACGSDNFVLGSVFQTPNPDGTMPGFDPITETAVVRSVTNPDSGYVFAYGNVSVDDLTIGFNAPNVPRAQIVAAGLIPGSTMGEVPTTGRASWIGQYALIEITGSASPEISTWERRDILGRMRIDVDFDNTIDPDTGFQGPYITGQSIDHLLTMDASSSGGDAAFVSGSLLFGSELDGGLIEAGAGNDPSDFADRTDINLTGGYFEGVLGEDGLIIAISADGDNIFFGGGLIAE